MKQESNIENKALINNTALFKEVSSVIGKVAALEELTKAYRGYEVDKGWSWDWDDCLVNAFVWVYTPQGQKFWNNIDESIKEGIEE
tara:strand:+ start:16863 stop:17120 length:258 start_codon:yes stop_codon:yes gene_type:complete